MTVPTHQFEAKVRAATHRTNKSGDWISVTLEIHPSDFPKELRAMAQAQQRVQAVIVAIGDDEQPVKVADKSARKPAATRAEKARRLCGVPKFQRFILGSAFEGSDTALYEKTSRYIKTRCGVASKSQLDDYSQMPGVPSPAARWDALLSEYEQATGRLAERR